jgi:putative transposase
MTRSWRSLMGSGPYSAGNRPDRSLRPVRSGKACLRIVGRIQAIENPSKNGKIHRGRPGVKAIPLIPGAFFHIFNRGNNRENLFLEDRNYAYFLRLYQHHIPPIADTYAYCLLRNHFHFLVKIKKDLHVRDFPAGFSKPFSNFFNAYARGFNRAYGRTGALFQRPFNRILVNNERHLLRLIAYIHQNPQKHGFVKDFREWPYSSFYIRHSDPPAFMERKNILRLFGTSRTWNRKHLRMLAGPDLEKLAPECFG